MSIFNHWRKGSCREENAENAGERETHHWDVVFKNRGNRGSRAHMEAETEFHGAVSMCQAPFSMIGIYYHIFSSSHTICWSNFHHCPQIADEEIEGQNYREFFQVTENLSGGDKTILQASISRASNHSVCFTTSLLLEDNFLHGD